MTAAAPIARPLDVRWIHGSPSAKHDTDPEIQVHEYDEHTVILRQNKAVHYEAPFLFLLFGAERAVLIDTGATADPAHFPLRATVDDLIAKWLARNPREHYPLLVLHTHPHGDHVAGDGQFADRPDTVLVGADRTTAWSYFGFARYPGALTRVDLGGGRVLECLATPGHHEAAVTYYDPWTGFLLTGDTVYPGRLYIDDWPAFGRSIERLIAFAEQYPVTYVLGCHIEMTREPGVDYPIRTTHQPDEPPLQLTVEHLHRIRAAVTELGDRPRRYALDDLILCPND
ncbi:MBL fold metallo-hydrolase [Kitasatospora sp. NPDC089509]|uniref:MBL fold metallo-hydrolase n=1 Tax=Kitasatospora sp. NPDC089509 TaxID=3364079 RepID=UPI00382F9B3E